MAVFTLAAGDTESQFPPLRVNFPSPIRDRMSFGVSFGPLANGVWLKEDIVASVTVIKSTLISMVRR